MCGRYVNVASSADLLSEFDAIPSHEALPEPSWNVAPTDPVPIIVQRASRAEDKATSEASSEASDEANNRASNEAHNGAHNGPSDEGKPSGRQIRTARWGLVPSWSRDRKGAARLINARIETVTSKPAFRSAAARRRCLIPALGYYEWQRTEHGKVPHFLYDPSGALLAMAGLYELWRDPELGADDSNRWFWSCTIITQQATDLLGEIHDRNPVVVPRQLRAQWLDCTRADHDVAAELLQRIPQAHLASHVVSPKVGNVGNNGAELIEPVTDRAPADQGTADQSRHTLDIDQLSLKI